MSANTPAPRSPGSGHGTATGPSHVNVQTESAPLASGGAGVQVEVDESDTDSAISTGPSTATTSISESVFDFKYANGRRYHADRFRYAEYFMPNDEREQDRLDFYHHMFLQFLGGKLYIAPLQNPQRVLDVGTGTGIWATDFADENPQAEVIGTDISPIQSNWVPTNCRFEVDDMEEVWTYPTDYFDFVHMRTLSGSFSNWNAVLENAYRTTKPGGYLEFQDYGCELYSSNGIPLTTPDPDRPFTCWLYYVVEAAKKLGRPLVVGRSMKGLMERAGFVDVTESTAIWPIGTWPKDKRLKETGRWGFVGLNDSLYPFAVHLLTKGLGWEVEKVKKLCDEAAEELPKSKYYFHGWFVYGRKPEAKNAG